MKKIIKIAIIAGSLFSAALSAQSNDAASEMALMKACAQGAAITQKDIDNFIKLVESTNPADPQARPDAKLLKSLDTTEERMQCVSIKIMMSVYPAPPEAASSLPSGILPTPEETKIIDNNKDKLTSIFSALEQ